MSVVEEIVEAQPRYKGMSLKLKVPPYIVESIEQQYLKPQDRLSEVILHFLRQAEPKPTWRLIVEALRSPLVNLPQLAQKIEEKHCSSTKARSSPGNNTLMGPVTPSRAQQNILFILQVHSMFKQTRLWWNPLSVKLESVAVVR